MVTIQYTGFRGPEVSESPSTLMCQAPITVGDYMTQAIELIDIEFGEGYARAHPELVGAFLQATARQFQTAVVKIGLQELRDALLTSSKY